MKKITRTPEILFLSGTTFFGLLFIILVPPFQIPDELTHFTRSYEVSEFKTPQRYEEKGVNYLGNMLPTSILKTYKKTSLHQISGYLDVPQAKKYSISDAKVALKIPLNKSDRTFFYTGALPAYFPPLYIPQAISIAFLNLLGAPIIVMLYATRLASLLVWILLVVLAFRFVRPVSSKLPLAAVLLLPMFISQASASTDSLINGSIVLYIAMIANFIIRKVKPDPSQTTILITILALTTLSKPVYAMFGLLLFLLPQALVRWRVVVRSIILFSTPFVIYGIWGLITKVSGPYYFDAINVGHADPSAQIQYIIPNVMNFFQPFMNTLLLNWGDGVVASLIGMFGKLDTPLPALFVILGYLIVLVAIVSGVGDESLQKNEQQPIRHSSKSVIISSLLVTGYILGVYLAMYIASTPPQEKIITGIQGRYLLPLIPFGVLFATKGYISFRNRSTYGTFLILSPIILLLASTVVVYLRYYLQYP